MIIVPQHIGFPERIFEEKRFLGRALSPAEIPEEPALPQESVVRGGKKRV